MKTRTTQIVSCVLFILVWLSTTAICRGEDVAPSILWLTEVQNPHAFSEGIAQVNKTHFIDSQGNLVFDSGKWHAVSTNAPVLTGFSSGLLLIEAMDQYTYVDRNGTSVFPLSAVWSSGFHSGYASVLLDSGNQGYFINCMGQVVQKYPAGYETSVFLSYPYTDNLIVLQDPETKLVGAYNLEQEEWLLPCEYQGIDLSLNTNTIPVRKDGAFGLLYKNGQEILPCIYSQYRAAWDKGIVWLYDGKYWGSVDLNTGEQLHPFTLELDSMNLWCDGLAAVTRNAEQGYINVDGEVVIPFGAYTYTGNFSEGLACVKGPDGKGLRGYIDTSGQLVIPYAFDSAYPFTEGLAWVQKDGVWGILEHPEASVHSEWADEGLTAAEAAGLLTARTERWFTKNITRLQFAELVSNLAEVVTEEDIPTQGVTPFGDTADVWARKAYVAGLVNGTGDGSTFSPNDYLTREQLATMLERTIRYIEENTGKTVLKEGDLTAYADAEQVSTWAAPSVSSLAATGIMQGTSATTLSPKDTTTVEQAILLILRAYQAFES